MTIQYKGFNASICNSTKTFDIIREDSRVDVACSSDANGTTVLTIDDWEYGLKSYEFENLWKDAVISSRIS